MLVPKSSTMCFEERDHRYGAPIGVLIQWEGHTIIIDRKKICTI
jgi:hypothetical protein